MTYLKSTLCVLFFLLIGMLHASALDDIVIADFEGADYGDWKVFGKSFGNAPAKGTLPNQMPVTGFEGKGLVNSFKPDDQAIGRLCSPEFVIERPFITFLIGGGESKRSLCLNLRVNRNIVRTVTGTQRNQGGSEALHWGQWDVSDLAGQSATIEIVDQHDGGWGHITVDQIVQTDQPVLVTKKRTLTVNQRYLNLPVKTGAPKKWVRLLHNDKLVREFDIELCAKEPSFWVFLDLEAFRNETLTLTLDKVEKGESKDFDAITLSDSLIGGENMYQEKDRPQFHFSSKRGWLNDPNGLVYHKGEYHLFYQHNPYGWHWGNMTWGHAVSKDLVHWNELGDAIHPDELGTIFSGSAIIDAANTTGFKTGEEDPLVCIYTYAGDLTPWSKDQPFTQGLAYSNDRGRTFTVYEGNPVQGNIRGANRDPKVFWHEESEQWVIALYTDQSFIAFLTSPDLKSWELQSELKCFDECPELFSLPVDGDKNNQKWVLYGGKCDYYIGDFDGKKFTPETEVLHLNRGNCFYASQTYNNIPEQDGRRVLIGWGQVEFPGMPFNQMMDFPVVLTLRSTNEGIRMFAEPVEEISNLYAKEHRWMDETLKEDNNPLTELQGDLFDIEAELEVGKAKTIEFLIRGIPVSYDVATQTLTCQGMHAALPADDGRIHLRLLVDRASIEIFGNHGYVYMPMKARFDDKNKTLALSAKDGAAHIQTIALRELNSAWKTVE